MFLHIERQYVNMLMVASVDEGINGQLRLNLANGKTLYAKNAEEVEAVQGAMEQLAYRPAQKSTVGTEPAPAAPKAARKKAA